MLKEVKYMYRTIDELGRVVIPSEYRKALQISEKERLSMKIKGKKNRDKESAGPVCLLRQKQRAGIF